MILKLGMKHQAIELYKICINHDPGMTLTFLRQGQLRAPMHLNGKNSKMSFNSHGHMTKIATMAISKKIFKKSSSEPGDL